jgi:hypothetical protein
MAAAVAESESRHALTSESSTEAEHVENNSSIALDDQEEQPITNNEALELDEEAVHKDNAAEVTASENTETIQEPEDSALPANIAVIADHIDAQVPSESYIIFYFWRGNF